jgi:hypothetical protein
MGKKKIKTVSQGALIERVTLVAALVTALILAAAAYGKFFYPVEALKTFDRAVSGFEVLFILFILMFRRRFAMWCAASVIFAAWGGYALFWCKLEVPCSCMGTLVEIPSLLSICVDGVLLIVSLGLSYLLGAGRQKLYLCVLLSSLAVLVGYSMAEWIYETWSLARAGSS